MAMVMAMVVVVVMVAVVVVEAVPWQASVACTPLQGRRWQLGGWQGVVMAVVMAQAVAVARPVPASPCHWPCGSACVHPTQRWCAAGCCCTGHSLLRP